MKIELKKFGEILTSRSEGREALLAINPSLPQLSEDEIIELDFSGVEVLTPSWADEFVTKLSAKYGNRVLLKNTENLSVRETLDFLSKLG